MNWFKTLGIFVGRALLDSRIIDFNFNTVFLKLLLDQPVKQNIATLKRVDMQLARSLEGLQNYLYARKEIESLPLVSRCHALYLTCTVTDRHQAPSAKRNKLMTLNIGGSKLGDLMLDFTLPGTSIELIVSSAACSRYTPYTEHHLSPMGPVSMWTTTISSNTFIWYST